MGFRFINEGIRQWFYEFIDPVKIFLVRCGVHPNLVSFAGFLFSIVTGLFLAYGYFLLAGIFLILAGLCDSIDGTIARSQGRESPFGAFIDSTLDRLGEIAIFSGLTFMYARTGDLDGVLLATFTLGGSLMVSYIRARAEGLSVECKVGIGQRPERFVLLILGVILAWIPGLGQYLLKFILLSLTILSHITVVQRISHVAKRLQIGGAL